MPAHRASGSGYRLDLHARQPRLHQVKCEVLQAPDFGVRAGEGLRNYSASSGICILIDPKYQIAAAGVGESHHIGDEALLGFVVPARGQHALEVHVRAFRGALGNQAVEVALNGVSDFCRQRHGCLVCSAPGAGHLRRPRGAGQSSAR